MDLINEGEYIREKTPSKQRLFEFHWVERYQELYASSIV